MRALLVLLPPLALALAPLFACTGQTCTVTPDCPAGDVCREGLCQSGRVDDPSGGGQGNGCGGPSGEVPNLISNSGFECGTGGWVVYPETVGKLSTSTEHPKSGAQSLVITQTATTQLVQVLSNTVTVQGPTTVCARAWMRGTAGDGHLSINHGVPKKAGTEDTFSSPISAGEWVLVRPSQPLVAQITEPSEEVTVKLKMERTQPGQTLEVDDVQLWVSPDGSCTERQ